MLRLDLRECFSTSVRFSPCASTNSDCARFFASVKIIWQRDSACTSASPLISIGRVEQIGIFSHARWPSRPGDIVFGMQEYGESSQVMLACL